MMTAEHETELTDLAGQTFLLGDWVEVDDEIEGEVVQVFKNGKIRVDYHDGFIKPETRLPSEALLSRRVS